MFDSFRKIIALLQTHERKKVLLIVMLMISTAFVQTAGVASVMPFLAVLSDPGMISSNAWLNATYIWFEFESTTSFLHALGIAAFIVFISGTALQALTHWVITRFTKMQQYHLSRRLLADYMRRPYTFYLSRNSGDLAKTVLQETAQAVNGALLPAMRLLSFSLLAAAIIALLITVEPVLAISVASALAIIYGTVYLFARSWLSRIGEDLVLANRERFTVVAEAFAGAKEIRLLGRELDYLERYRHPSRRFAVHQANATLLESLPQYAIEAIAFGGVLLIILVLMSGDGGLATALPLIGLYGLAGKQLIPAFQRIFGTISSIRFNMPAVENILDDFSEHRLAVPLPPADKTLPALVPHRSIEIDDLTYHYPDTEQPALNHLSLSIKANTTVGFVGSSGAGKSTLIDLILGLLDPDKGEIRIDDTRLQADNIRNWQAGLGYVPQHIFLADQTVAANIALGLPPEEIDHAAVQKAARLANLHDFVTSELPLGYDTVIGERGVRLSGGQRQRIGIARALYRDPTVLIFDEATSALDNTTERAVMEAIHHLKGEKTIILVAHRLTTVKPCNQIFVLEKGKIVEQGSWEELVVSNSHFQHLASGTLQG